MENTKVATIQFKGKVRSVRNPDGSHAYDYIAIPELDRKHCDMAAFRAHPKYGAYANSDMFKSILSRIKVQKLGSLTTMLKLNDVPEGVNVDTSSFLAVVTITV